MLSGLISIWMNEATFRSLSNNIQLSDYLLIGKSLFPQVAYVGSTSFKSKYPNNFGYSSATERENKAGQRITTLTSNLKKRQEINHKPNKGDTIKKKHLY